VDRMGVRLALRRAQADAGDIALIYADESEALTHPYLAHAWAEKGADLRVQAPGASRKVAMMGALDAATGELIVSTSPTKTSIDFIALLHRLDWRHGPKPGCERLPIVLVLDNGPIHTSRASRAALAERPWITVEWVPRYAPELNDIERTWRDLKRHHLAHRTFQDAADLTCAIHAAVKQLNKERMNPHPCDKLEKAA
jgi:transposase